MNSRGNVTGTAKLGKVALGPGSVLEMMAMAVRSAPAIIHNHDSLLLQEEMNEEEP